MWDVWGDGTEPVATGLTETEMRHMVDNDDTETLYGQDENGNEYEGD